MYECAPPSTHSACVALRHSHRRPAQPLLLYTFLQVVPQSAVSLPIHPFYTRLQCSSDLRIHPHLPLTPQSHLHGVTINIIFANPSSHSRHTPPCTCRPRFPPPDIRVTHQVPYHASPNVSSHASYCTFRGISRVRSRGMYPSPPPAPS